MGLSKMALAAGVSEEHIHHLKGNVPPSVMPINVMGKIDIVPIEKTHYPTSHHLSLALATKGAIFSDVRAPIYSGSNREGAPRRVDNEDLILGYPQLYDSVSHLQSVLSEARKPVAVVNELIASGSHPYIGRMEGEDVMKFAIQRVRPPGWFLDEPFYLKQFNGPFSNLFISTLRVILKKYARFSPEFSERDNYKLIMMDSDPETTSSGMPTMTAGLMANAARIATFAAMPPPSGTPGKWLDACHAVGSRLGVDASVFLGCAVFTRSGPIKPDRYQQMWFRDAGAYLSKFASASLYARTRFVYPFPHMYNFMLSPLYIQWSGARKKIPGLWHTPELTEKIISHMRAQGKESYTIDFSSMDKSIGQGFITLLAQEASIIGFSPWTCELLDQIIKRIAILFPSYSGVPGDVSAMTGTKPWMSGVKLTSEVDTLYGLATVLSALELQIPGIVAKWDKGEFMIAALGDDQLFTTDHAIDVDRLIVDSHDLSGAVLKVQPGDAMFLKRFMPVVSGVPELSKPFSRIIQQTFGNEDRYNDDAGVRPYSVMRAGTLARCDLIRTHPWFDKVWPSLWSAMSQLKYFQETDRATLSQWASGHPCLAPGDEKEILLFSLQQPQFMDKLIARANVEPSAAALLRLFGTFGIDTQFDKNNYAVRNMYMNALISKPSDRKSVV